MYLPITAAWSPECVFHTRRRKQDRHLEPVEAHPPHDLEAVEIGQHHVEQHDVGNELLDLRQGVASVVGHLHLVTKVFFFQAEDGIRDYKVTGVQTCALPI